MFNWLNLSTKKSFSTEKGETMKTSKMSKQDRLVNALRMKGYAVYANKSKNGKTIYKMGAPLRRVVAAGYKALANEKVFG